MKLNTPREFATALDLNSTHWIVSGGFNEDFQYLTSVEIYDTHFGEFFPFFEDLPLALKEHCMVRVGLHFSQQKIYAN